MTSAPSGLGSTPISLFYTTDNLTYIPIASAGALANGANGCTPDANHSGCYQWTNGSPVNTFFAVRAVVTDNANITAADTSSPINSWPPISFLAGATDPGTNGSATSAMFTNAANAYADGQGFVISESGVLYFRDKIRGILKVDPTTGNQTILIPKTGIGYVDGTVTGLTTGATVTDPNRLALDFQGRLLVQEVNAIRRYDPTSNTISTIIGGVSASGTGPTTSAATTKMATSLQFTGSKSPLFAVPDGRIYFGSEDNSSLISPNSRLRIYTPGDSTVRSLLPSGVGNSVGPTEDLSTYGTTTRYYGFDPATSNLDAMMYLMSKNGNAGFKGNFNPITGVSLSTTFMATPPSGYLSIGVPGMDGEIYAVGVGRIDRYNKSTLGWVPIAGTGTPGISIDTSPALTSKISPSDVFVNSSGKVFFYERGVIRAIDQAAKIVTIAGSSRSSGDDANALSARIGFVDDFKLWNDGVGGGDQIIFSDSSEVKLRQFKIGGNIKKLAGNGTIASPNTTGAALNQPLFTDTVHTEFLFQVHPTNGNIYSSARFTGISMLDQVTNLWTDWVGQGSTYTYITGDTQIGSSIMTGGYVPLMLGFDGSKILAGFYRYNVTYVDALIKSFPIAGTHVQSSFAGAVGLAGPYMCTSGTALSSCLTTQLGSGASALNQLKWDSYQSTWVGMHYAQPAASGRRVFTMTDGGNLTDIATLPAGAFAFDRRHDASNDLIYYCSTADSRLHRYNITTSTDSTYAWPIPSMQCGSHNLIYSSSRNSLIFAYQVNGLWGIAEYLNP